MRCHKSQGSEYPAVILLLYPQHYLMLSRNLFYTGLTRAKRLALVVGPNKAIGIAINRVENLQRTGLTRRLVSMSRSRGDDDRTHTF